jgi:hypothetical protein
LLECHEASKHHLLKFGFFLLDRQTSVSYCGKTCYYAHHTFLLGFPTGWSSCPHQNPRLFLARRVHPLLIYVICEGCRRIKTTSIEQTHLYFFVFIYLSLPCTFASRSLLFFNWKAANPWGSGGIQANLGQPIAAARPDGVSPGRVGFRVSKRPLDCLAYRTSDEPPSACAATHHARRRGYTVTCSCVNTHKPLIGYLPLIGMNWKLEVSWTNQITNWKIWRLCFPIIFAPRYDISSPFKTYCLFSHGKVGYRAKC